MSIFSKLVAQIHTQLAAITVTHDIVELCAEIHDEAEDNLLAWLKAQRHFPQSFWQSRDKSITYATVGKVKSFEQLALAQAFSQQYGFRLFGGLQFEGQCCFILPRLVLAKSAHKLTACLYLDAANLAIEKATCAELLAQFEQIATFSLQDNLLLETHTATSFNQWQHNVAQAIGTITQQQVRKVVLANATTLTFQKPICSYDLLFASQQENRGCYHFLWADQANCCFIGSSPERLYQRKGSLLRTEALAGTVAVTEDVGQTERNGLWLLSDQKNIHENQLVVDDIRQQLASYVSEFEVSELGLKRLHNVQHLRRHIQVRLQPMITDSDCLSRIHPTAAVAGLPRASALPFIQQYEGFSREWYAGTLGSFTPQQAEFCVTLRSAKIVDNQITLYAGAGIVLGSDAQSEWEEIERKRLALGRFL